MVRSAVARALTEGGLEVIGEASNGEDGVELVLELRPDVVVIAINLPRMPGVETIGRLALLAPSSRVLVLTRSDSNQVVEAIVAGASGYILKTAPPEEILTAVRATAAGESVLSPEIAGKLIDRIRERELEIFELLASGKSNQMIASALSLSTHTVSNHIKSILAKLQLDNRVQAAVQAVRTGIA